MRYVSDADRYRGVLQCGRQMPEGPKLEGGSAKGGEIHRPTTTTWDPISALEGHSQDAAMTQHIQNPASRAWSRCFFSLRFIHCLPDHFKRFMSDLLYLRKFFFSFLGDFLSTNA